jgi:hypothetical protein
MSGGALVCLSKVNFNKIDEVNLLTVLEFIYYHYDEGRANDGVKQDCTVI